eukprot:COSAG02_NODE_20028_length_851_cov_1.461436_2_plen_106_part_00
MLLGQVDFFFKQKTAYQISECDWRLAVCSFGLPVTVEGVGSAVSVGICTGACRIHCCANCAGAYGIAGAHIVVVAWGSVWLFAAVGQAVPEVVLQLFAVEVVALI